MEALRNRPAADLIAMGVAPVKAAHWRTDVLAAPLPGGVAAGGEAAPSKSKRQKRKESVNNRKLQLCHAFREGTCARGDTCKFMHDIAAAVGAKPADLPGACPFALSPGNCPYGVMCRWASKHGAGPEAADTGATAGPADAPPTHPLPVLLPLLPQAEAANPVPACMWNDLKRRRYDFGRANGVLAGLGLPLGPDAKKNKARAALARENAAGAGGAPAGAPAVPGPVGEAEAAAEAAAPKPEPASPAPTAPAHAPEPAPSPSPEPLPAPVPPPSCDYVEARLHARERIPLDLRDKLYLAPLTTVGNLPFRALCVGLGADVTCGEMALATTLLQGAKSEWALARRHVSERCFGVQICGGYPDAMAHAAQALTDACPALDFIDINLGCPIDCVCGRGAGAALLTKPGRVEAVCRAVAGVSDVPLTIKVRKGYKDGEDVVHTWVPKAAQWGVSAVTVHGRSRQQRYTRDADWDYVARLSEDANAAGLQVIGSGDVLSWPDYRARRAQCPAMAGIMLARGALIKPWLFTEIKECRDWDISAGERLDLLAAFCSHGLGHWGSDARGVETTRRFLLEWLSFAWRYVPVGLLEVTPQRMGWRPPPMAGRSDLETLLASPDPADWVRISERLLGPAPPGFVFTPKHKSNAYTYVAEGEGGGGGGVGEENG